MKAYKVELLMIDFDQLGPDEIRSTIENQKYPNYCISPDVMAVEGRDIGDWHDDHPLNNRNTVNDEYKRLFNN